MPSEHDILVSTDGNVRILTLNRPRRLNAWTDSMRLELIGALKQANGEDRIGAVVITGAGDRAFCSGQDFNEVHDHDGESTARWMETWASFFDTLRSMSKPIVAALNGLAVGSGFQVALLCDLRVAHSGVKLGQPEINQGVVSIFGAWILREMLGHARTVELVLTGRLMASDECEKLGLVTQVVAQADVLSTSVTIAEELAGKSPEAMRRNKAWLRALTEPGFIEAANASVSAHAEVFSSGAPGERMKQFLKDEKQHG